jgi:hypothetical protein
MTDKRRKERDPIELDVIYVTEMMYEEQCEQCLTELGIEQTFTPSPAPR